MTKMYTGSEFFAGSTELQNNETGNGYFHTKSERRKVRKVIVERKRRERIERCLDQLKQILVQSVAPLQSETGTNLEKADILELTISHLKELQTRSHLQITHGYLACAQEVNGFLQNVNCDPSFRHRVTQFLLKRQPTGSSSKYTNGSVIAPISSLERVCGDVQHPTNVLNFSSASEQYVHLSMCSGIESQPLESRPLPTHTVVQSAVIDTTSSVTCYDVRQTDDASQLGRSNCDTEMDREPILANDSIWRPW